MAQSIPAPPTLSTGGGLTCEPASVNVRPLALAIPARGQPNTHSGSTLLKGDIALAAVCGALLGAVAIELVRYFDSPLAPDEPYVHHPSDNLRDATRVPEAMARECRERGEQLLAHKTDGPDWIYECIALRGPQ